ncbi:MAG: diacylglycerol kinase family protein [Patescibacteria group bacterium]
MPIVNFRSLIKSFRYACRGIIYAFQNEQNFRLQVIIAVIVCLFMWIFGVTRNEAIILFLLIFLVLILELINTTFEKLVDILQPRIHHYVAVIKNLMAAMVFLASLGALIIALLIFLPYLFRLF